MILNPDNICLECGGLKGRDAATCQTCKDGITHGITGRKPTYTDEQIVARLEPHRGGGYMTVDMMLFALGLKSKTTLIKRLRKMRDAGLIILIERSRHDGFLIKGVGNAH